MNGISEGEKISEVYDVDNFAVTGESSDNFTAALTGRTTGQSVLVNSETATTQAIPAVIVLGILARIGLRATTNQFGKAQVKKAAKSYFCDKTPTNGDTSWPQNIAGARSGLNLRNRLRIC